jgi:hypothetical protein
MSSKLAALAFLACVAAPNVRAADHELFTAVLRDHARAGLVDYAALASDERLTEYLASVAATDPAAIDDERERLAFWINAYNAFTLQLILEEQPRESIREIERDDQGPWDIPFIRIRGKLYTLNQIEHQIIRTEFSEPRIHMALVCAARSCPPLRTEAYRGRTLEEQLEDNTRRFLADSTQNRYDPESATVSLSEIFSWFAEDFVAVYGSVEQFIRRYYPIEPGQELQLKYLPYDWSLNRAVAVGSTR